MRKVWHLVSYIVMACLLLGVLGIAVGFFTGSSPTVIASRGHLDEYGERLMMNLEILRRDWNNIVWWFQDTVQAVKGLF